MEQEQEVYSNILSKLTPEERVVLNLKQQLLERQRQVEVMEKQVELTEAKKQVEVLQVQLNAKENALAQLNYEKLERKGFIELRGFIDYYDTNYINLDISVRSQRFSRFVQNHPTLMKKWDLHPSGFEKWFSRFYDKLNRYAHPFFQTKNTFSLTEGLLEPKDIKFIALLWDIAPLPKENLYIEVDNVKHNLFKYFEK